jgi:hypothetical protein
MEGQKSFCHQMANKAKGLQVKEKPDDASLMQSAYKVSFTGYVTQHMVRLSSANNGDLSCRKI